MIRGQYTYNIVTRIAYSMQEYLTKFQSKILDFCASAKTTLLKLEDMYLSEFVLFDTLNSPIFSEKQEDGNKLYFLRN